MPTLSYAFSSDPSVGAINIRNDGSSFSVALDTPINIPKGSKDCVVELLQASIWNTSPNIATAYGNNMFYISYNSITYPLTIPDGLYSVGDLNTIVSRLIMNLGLPSNLISISGDSATQKIVISYSLANTRIDFTQPNTIRLVLGFDARLSPLAGVSTVGYSDFGDSSANFNRINSFFIRSSLVMAGLPINTFNAGIIASVPITASPGSQINYQPTVPISVDGSNLPNSPLQYISFDLLDQKLRPVNTMSECWSIIIHIKFS